MARGLKINYRVNYGNKPCKLKHKKFVVDQRALCMPDAQLNYDVHQQST